jgi:hypothetical protein
MGRPINKRYFGPLTGSGLSSADGKDQAGNTLTNASLYSEKKLGYNIPVYKARVTGGDLDTGGDAAETPYIISQKGSKKYRVQTSDGVGNCVLVNDDGSSGIDEGEMVIAGFLGGDAGAGSPIFIQKLTKFYAIDFSGTRYKWHVAPNSGEDSTLANVLVLTAADDASIN